MISVGLPTDSNWNIAETDFKDCNKIFCRCLKWKYMYGTYHLRQEVIMSRHITPLSVVWTEIKVPPFGIRSIWGYGDLNMRLVRTSSNSQLLNPSLVKKAAILRSYKGIDD